MARHRGHFLAGVCDHHGHRILILKRRLSTEHVVGDRPQRIQIAPRIEVPAPECLFRSHVERCATDHVVGRELRCARFLNQLDQTEIENLHKVAQSSTFRNVEIARLQVTVNEASRVGLRQRAARLSQEIDDAPWWQRAVLRRAVGRG